jgi:hypothetical protein
MPGLKMFKRSFYSNIGANQHIVAGTINLGCTRGRGSSTRMFSYCKKRSLNPSGCIDQFVTFRKQICQEIKIIDISSIAKVQYINGNVWVVNPNTIISKCQTLNYSDSTVPIGVFGTFTNNGTININNAFLYFVDGTSSNNGTINISNGAELYNISTNTEGSILNNNGTINLNQTKLNNGQFPSPTATLNNNGKVNNSGSTIDNLYGVINNIGNIYNGDGINCPQGTITNYGTINGNSALNVCPP